MPSVEVDGRRRVVIEGVAPAVENGRYPIKRIAGDSVIVEADVFADGHDELCCRLLYRHSVDETWTEVAMSPLGNDRWRGEFSVTRIGEYFYTIESWTDRFVTWRHDLIKRIEARQELSVEMLIGAELAESAAKRCEGDDSRQLQQFAESLRSAKDPAERATLALDDEVAALMERHADRRFARRYGIELPVVVDRTRARFSAWYELFPRSCGPNVEQHGTFRDCEQWLPYVASMGFDVLYLPPIHPIGVTFRKGKNNAVTAEAGDVGSPWAIGSAEGGHKSIHPALGNMEEFEHLIASAANFGIEVAMDIAFQCTPDHPYVREHPSWFRHRPDGTIQYAENPPKKYQDIYPIDFESDDWESLWHELKSVFTFWIDRNIKIFRVDNPHTKAFPFWEWAIRELKRDHPDVLFLAEAFTRPRVMERLAKLGYSQSYTYFTWRNSKNELTEYFEGLKTSKVREYLRPNLWPNTPDILPEHLQVGGRPAFLSRLVLAATLGASYGIYGPAFELCENTPRAPGSEEYLHSEKYEIKHRDLNAAISLKDFIARINRIRRENPALHSDSGLRFHDTDNPMLICYSKVTGDLSNGIVVVVNLDPFHTQSGWVTLDLASLGIAPDHSFQMHELITDSRYVWQGPRNYVELNPSSTPAAVMRSRKRIKTERDFDYYL